MTRPDLYVSMPPPISPEAVTYRPQDYSSDASISELNSSPVFSIASMATSPTSTNTSTRTVDSPKQTTVPVSWYREHRNLKKNLAYKSKQVNVHQSLTIYLTRVSETLQPSYASSTGQATHPAAPWQTRAPCTLRIIFPV